MAITAIAQDSVLIVEYEQMVEGKDTPVTRQKSFPYVRTEALPQDVYDVANAFFGLLDHTVLKVRRNDQNVLMEE